LGLDERAGMVLNFAVSASWTVGAADMTKIRTTRFIYYPMVKIFVSVS
jgi:hypothetical protein